METPDALESKVAPEVRPSRPCPATSDEIPQPAVDTLPVERRREKGRTMLTGCLSLALLAGTISIPARWQRDLHKRSKVLSSELQAMETQWTAASQQRGQAERAWAAKEGWLKLAKRIGTDRAAPRWAGALRIIATAAGPSVELRAIHASGKPTDQGACDLRIDGSCAGLTPRAGADQLWRELEANLKRHFPADGVTTRLDRLDDEPPLPSASPNQTKAAFTILVTTGAKAVELASKEGR